MEKAEGHGTEMFDSERLRSGLVDEGCEPQCFDE